jgi:16S rRNA (uracil1498-N3)-methyltransferase
MARRIHVRHLTPGQPIALGKAEAHHARDVLRLVNGATVEVFDDAGLVGQGVFQLDGTDAFVHVERLDETQRDAGISLTVAAAVPKGDRADWMVEKLSELGVARLIPLAAARSVVLPTGTSKRDRWIRIATEAAKQSRRAGVMRVTELTSVADALRDADRAWFLSTEADRPTPVAVAIRAFLPGSSLTAFIGPEGGWSAQEQQAFAAAGATAVRLTRTILRVETAAVTTAAIVACAAEGRPPDVPLDAPVLADDDPAAHDASGASASPRTPT